MFLGVNGIFNNKKIIIIAKYPIVIQNFRLQWDIFYRLYYKCWGKKDY